MAALIADRDLRDGLRRQARQTAAERFARKRLGPQLLAAYERFGARR